VAEVADLFASLGLKFDEAAWNKADARLAAAKKAMDVLSRAGHPVGMNTSKAMGVVGLNVDKARKKMRELGNESQKAGRKVGGAFSGATSQLSRLGAMAGVYFGGRAAYGALVGFNSRVEDTKLQIAGMLALSKKTDLADQLKVADGLYASLQKRAASLPGTTAEYVAMAGKLARVITDSGGSMKDLEDLTVNAIIAAKGLGENWEVAARDIEQALMGRYNTTDPFLKKVLPSIGYTGESGQEKWRELSKEKRFAELRRALLQKQFTQLGEAQGKTFSGVLSTMKDSVEQFFGKVGKPLFEGLSSAIRQVNVALDANKDKVQEVAEKFGGALVVAFNAVASVVTVLASNLNIVIPILVMMAGAFVAVKIAALAAWIAALGPIALIAAAIAGAVYLIIRFRTQIVGALKATGRAIADSVMWVVNGIKKIVSRVAEFFTDDIPDAIRKAFEWLADLPVIKQLVDLVSELRSFGGSTSTKNERQLEDLTKLPREEYEKKYPTPPETQKWLDDWRSVTGPQPLSVRPTSPGVSIGTVSVGDLNISSSSADPKQVALEVKRVFHDEFSGVLRETMDVV
jgi:hypothetical protein